MTSAGRGKVVSIEQQQQPSYPSEQSGHNTIFRAPLRSYQVPGNTCVDKIDSCFYRLWIWKISGLKIGLKARNCSCPSSA